MQSIGKAIAVFYGMFVVISCAQNPESGITDNAGQHEDTFDSLLAAELGADPYGMRQYVFAYLKEGPNRNQDSLESAKIQRAHLDNITKMAEDGKLILAGPFLDDGDIRGIYIFAVESVAEAQQLTETDPAVRTGRLTMELHPWYGSAALMKVNELHQKIAREGI